MKLPTTPETRKRQRKQLTGRAPISVRSRGRQLFGVVGVLSLLALLVSLAAAQAAVAYEGTTKSMVRPTTTWLACSPTSE